MKNCVECNELLENDAKFCSICGAKQPEKSIEIENLFEFSDYYEFDKFKSEVIKCSEILEKIYNEDLDILRKDISVIKQQAELIPLRPGKDNNFFEEKEQQLLMSERINNIDYSGEGYNEDKFHKIIEDIFNNLITKIDKSLFNSLGFTFLEIAIFLEVLMINFELSNRKALVELIKKILNETGNITDNINEVYENTYKSILNYIDKLVAKCCDVYFTICKKYLSDLSKEKINSKIAQLSQRIKEYNIHNNVRKPWVNETRYWSDIFLADKYDFNDEYGLYDEYDLNNMFSENIVKLLDDSQEYINTMIDETEKLSIETLKSIRDFYENGLKAVILIPFLKK